jgi:hypothetical protein
MTRKIIPRIIVDLFESLCFTLSFFRTISCSFSSWFGKNMQIRPAMRNIIDLIVFAFMGMDGVGWFIRVVG